MPTVEELLRGYVTLEVECVDRLYLNGYIPNLATAGAVIVSIKSSVSPANAEGLGASARGGAHRGCRGCGG